MITLILATTWRRMPWKNGQGESFEIAVEDGGHTQFLWRLSIAEVAKSGSFSAYPGVERWITVLEGAGMRLTVGPDTPRVMRQLESPFCFDGGTVTRCDLLGGPIRDFNLMFDRRYATGRMQVMVGPCERQVQGHVVLLYAVSAGTTVSVRGTAPLELAPTDTAVVRAADSSVALAAGATAILAQIIETVT